MDAIFEAYERQVAITTGLAQAIEDAAPLVDGEVRAGLLSALRMACGATESLTAMLLADAAIGGG